MFVPDPVVPGRISVYERWTDADAPGGRTSSTGTTWTCATRCTPHGPRGAETLRFRIDAVAQVYDEDRAARPLPLARSGLSRGLRNLGGWTGSPASPAALARSARRTSS